MTRGAGSSFQTSCHASCIVLDEDGVLVRGPSGSGKSALCLALLDRFSARGRHARLVGDDRIVLSVRHDRLVARAHPELAGMIEIRGAGLCRLASSAEAAVVRLVVDLVEALPRMPEEGGESVVLAGLRLPVLRLDRRQPHEYLIDEALTALQRKRLARGGVSLQTHPELLLKFEAEHL